MKWLRRKERKSSDQLNQAAEIGRGVAAIVLPTRVMLGFQEGISKKDLMAFLQSKGQDLMNGSICRYQVVRRDGGYYWELQEGGSGRGILKAVLEALDQSPVVHFECAERIVRATRNSSGALTSYILNEGAEAEITADLQYAEKLRPLSSQGNGVLISGIVLSGLGVVSLALAATLKYLVISPYEPERPNAATGPLPFDKMAELSSIERSPVSYAKALVYDPKGRKFVIELAQEAPKPVSEPSDQLFVEQMGAESRSKTASNPARNSARGGQ